jgi:murein L,D-transpeptidase YcbB/YkuD
MKRRIILVVLFLLQLIPVLTAQEIEVPGKLQCNYPLLLQQFYQRHNSRLFWYDSTNAASLLRAGLLSIADSIVTGLNKQRYHYEILRSLSEKHYAAEDSAAALQADKIFTDAAITLMKDIYQGVNINALVSYDELSAGYAVTDDDLLIDGLLAVTDAASLIQFFSSLHPADEEYYLLNQQLQIQQQQKNALQVKQLVVALNYFRWMHHFKFDKMIVVNIASATLFYYENDSIKLKMKVVVGKPATKTPRFAARCNQVILYPYWNVPASIALNELLPRFKKNPAAVDEMNMQVIDRNGTVLDHHKMNWKNYSSKNFPYRFRQSTGCDNSLGVIKFNITDPYSVYLHDTNNKIAFFSGYRYYSHGCIRVEQPIELANVLLNGRADTSFLNACYKQQVPVPVDLLKPVPVFVIYSTAATDASGKIKYYKDIYGLLKP